MSEPTTLTIARLCNLIYQNLSDPTWKQVWQKDDVIVGHAVVEGVDFVILRGSVSTEDWLRDFEAVPVEDALLGTVHLGFLTGMDDVYAEVSAVVGHSVAIGGHSLGGARARILAGLFVANGNKAEVMLCTFGSPKPGYQKLADILESGNVWHQSRRNALDVVPTLPPLGEWVHTEQYLSVNVPAASIFSEFSDHHMPLYLEAEVQLCNQPQIE